jgi:WD40 repeat protein
MAEFDVLSVENQEAIEELAWTLQSSPGEFLLLIACCNYGQLRDRAIAALQELVPNVALWRVPEETEALLDGIQDAASAVVGGAAAVMVTGLGGVQELEVVLGSMNRIREEFRSRCPYPVVLWLTDVGLRSLMRYAPDFESWGTTTRFEMSEDSLDKWLADKINDWINDELEKPQDLTVDWSLLEEELITIADYFESGGITMDVSLLFYWHAILGSSYLGQRKVDQAILAFQQALASYQEVIPARFKAKVLRDLVRSCYTKAIDRQDLNHPYWVAVREFVDQYLEFCQQYCSDFTSSHFPAFLGDILIRLDEWDVLEDLAKAAREWWDTKENPFKARPYGYLAEVSAHQEDWEGCLSQATKALEIVKSSEFKESIASNQLEILAKARLLISQIDSVWYRFLIAKSRIALGDIAKATTELEELKSEIKLVRHSRLCLQILKSLEDLHRSQEQLLQAFTVKQERLMLEQQMSIRAFVGAGRLCPDQNVVVSWNNLISTELSPKEISSAIRASGRSQDIQRICDRIGSTEYKLTVLYGTSGVGKSSLVEGGVVPALQRKAIGTRDNKPVLIRQYTNWSASLLDAMDEDSSSESKADCVAKILDVLAGNEERNLRTVLIFDQFEEFFFVRGDRESRQPFYEFLGRAIGFSNVKVILSMREDYLHYLLECRGAPGMEIVNGGDVLGRSVLYEIGNFSPGDARSIIEELTTRAQFALEPALLDRLVADLAEPLGAVRPIELQIVGAQLQEEGIRELAGYPAGGKAALVDGYLMATVGDCGVGNGALAELVGYLLTDERGTRPLKTRGELERELEELKKQGAEPEQLDLVLAVLVGSGLVMRLKAVPEDRYQLVHDYLAGVIRKRQQPRFDRIAQELAAEKAKRQEAERDLDRAKVSLGELQDETKKAEVRLAEANRQVIRRTKLGTGILVVSGVVLAAALTGSVMALQAQRNAQIGTRLEREGAAAMEEFKSQQTKGILSAMRAVKELKETGKERQPLAQYPAASPFLALQTSLDKSRETVFKGHQGVVLSVVYSPDGKTVATSGQDGTARLWGLSGKQLSQFKGHQGSVFSVVYSPDGKTVATRGEDGTARLWDLSGKQLSQFKGHQGSVLSVVYSPDGKTMATSGEDGTARLWDLSGKQLSQFKGHQGSVMSVVYSSDGKTVATSGEDGTARLWDLTGKQLSQFKGHQGSVLSVVYSPDGKTMATSGEDGTARLWDLSGKQLSQFKGHQGSVLSVVYSPDGKTVATRGEDGTARLWDLSGKQLSQFKDHQGSVFSVVYSPDGKTVATSGEDGTARLWDLSGKQLSQFKGHQGSVLSVVYSPDGKTVATTEDYGTARLWDLSGKQLSQFKGHQGSVMSVAYSPDGKTVATSGEDGTARLWDLSGKQLSQFKGHQGSIFSVVYSPDEKMVATRGEDRTARFWDLLGRQIAQYDGTEDYSINADWSQIATVIQSLDNPENQIVTLHPVTLSPTALLDRACQRLKYYILQSPELESDRKMCSFKD